MALLMHACLTKSYSCLTVAHMLHLFHMFHSLLTSVFTSMFPLINELHACLTFSHANLTEVLSMCKILPDSSAQNSALSSSRPIVFESRVPFFTWNRSPFTFYIPLYIPTRSYNIQRLCM